MTEQNNFDSPIDFSNAIFEKSEALVKAVSLLNGSRLELLDYFGDSCKVGDGFHSWLVGVAVSRVCDGIADLTVLCNEIFDIMQQAEKFIDFSRGDEHDTQ